MQKVIAIDGPCGSGKSSIAKQLSLLLNVTHIDTGSMYRALGYYFQENGFDLEQLESDQVKNKALSLLSNLKLIYVSKPTFKILVNDEDVTEIIRIPKVASLASVISQYDFIRDYLTKFQRELVLNEVCVMEGRDIGTIVFPKAICKFYLTATENERAKRRLEQYKIKGCDLELQVVLEEVKCRDQKDMNRKIAPLVQAEDAVLIDSTQLSEVEVIEKLKGLIQEKLKKRDISL